jgi:hypothetical protein
MAAAVRQQAVPQVLQDLIMFGEGLSLTERPAEESEIGKPARSATTSPAEMVIAVKRGGTLIPFSQLGTEEARPGDVLVLMIDQSAETADGSV